MAVAVERSSVSRGEKLWRKREWTTKVGVKERKKDERVVEGVEVEA